MKKFILLQVCLLLLVVFTGKQTYAETDRKTKVSVNDSTAGFLNGKLVAGSNVSFVENNDGSNETLQINATTSGSGVVIDLADDSSNESTSLAEIATSGDTYTIFTEPTADKLLINLANKWPLSQAAVALNANGSNCSVGNAPLGVDAAGAAESCFDVEEEGQLSATVVTGNAADDQVLLGTGSNALSYTIVPNCTDTGGNHLNYNQSTNTWSCGTTGGASGYNQMQDEASNLTQRTTLNFTGAGVACADTGSKTECTIPGSGSATISVDEEDSLVDNAVTTLDFRPGFDVTSSPAGEANVFMDLSETVTGDILFNTSNVGIIQADSVTLTTDTTGNYVQSVATTSPLAGGASASEGTVISLSITADGINGTELSDNITIDTATRLGDAGSNYTQVDTNGALTYAGTAKPNRTVILTSTGAILPATNGAASTTLDGTNVDYKVLDFDATTDESAYWTFILPDSWDAGTITLRVRWQSSAITNDVVWAIQTACVADGEAADASLNTANTVTDTAKGTANQLNDADISSVTVTGCAAGELVHVKIYRDADNGSDTMTGDARFIYAKLEYAANSESD